MPRKDLVSISHSEGDAGTSAVVRKMASGRGGKLPQMHQAAVAFDMGNLLLANCMSRIETEAFISF